MSGESFADLGASRVVISTLTEAGITEPFAIQRGVIADAIAGRDVIAQSPTGSGKTLAFGIPLVERIAAEDPRPAALVLAPTRELATQIVADIRRIAHARALRITAVYGGVGLVKQAKDAAASHILVATPGRLEDLLARGAFRLNRIRMLVLDEADRMLDMGFRPAIDRIVAACPQNRQTLFFSATLEGEAGRIATRYAQDPAIRRHDPPTGRTNGAIEHKFVQVAHEHRVEALVRELRRERDLTLVFVRTKRGADRLLKRLTAHGVKAAAMHGDKSQRQREQALSKFASGAIDTLIATDVAARGIDVDRISHVINFDPPADSDTYVHRVGRTGRAGRTGIGITLLSPEQRHDVTKLAGHLGIDHDLHAPAPVGQPGDTVARGANQQNKRRRPRVRERRRPGVRAIGTGILSVAFVGVLLWLAPPAQVIDSIGEMSPVWLLAAAGFEVGSCLSYVVVFRRFFPEPPRPVSRQVAWIAMGAGAVLPGGNFSSAATTGWLLRHHVGAGRLVERCGALLCFLTLLGFFINGVAGALLLLGIGHGPHDLAHSGIPILVSLFVIGSALAAMIFGHRHRTRAPAAVRSAAESLHGAWRALLVPDWRMLGAAGFLCLDMAALWAACRATGHPLGVLALAVAYFIGYLATMIPLPAGIGVLDSGLAGALVLYGYSPAASVGAVLVYHAISVWIPGLGGLVAWLPTRRRPSASVAAAPAAAETDAALAGSR